MIPVLYSFRRCPYAMRARSAIVASGLVCELREVVLRDKPAALLDASPKATVPVLVEPDGTVIEQSLDIMLWALRQNDPDAWLPSSVGKVSAMNRLITDCDESFKFHLDRYKYPQRYGNVDRQVHRGHAALWLHELDAVLTRRPFLCGEKFTMADAAIAPFVRQFAHTDLDWFDIQRWPALRTWLLRWTQSTLFDGIMKKYPPWVEGQTPVLFPG